MGLEGGEVAKEGGGGGGDSGAGDDSFVGDAGEEAALGGCAKEGLEGAVELRRGWGGR